MAMKFLDLCAGIGGFSLGLERAGMKCAGQVEKDGFCTKVLEKHWPAVPKWRDIREANFSGLPPVELICGGYPCQPFSLSGKRAGEGDDRCLWPFILSLVAEKRPDWCLFENVVGHVSLGLDQVLSDLENIGYTCWAVIVPACAVDAPHRRERLWIFANAVSHGRQWVEYESSFEIGASLLLERLPPRTSWISRRYELPESRICTRNDGLPERMARHLEVYGNAVVPYLVQVLGSAIIAAHAGRL